MGEEEAKDWMKSCGVQDGGLLRKVWMAITTTSPATL
jgi:hypothetical protein